MVIFQKFPTFCIKIRIFIGNAKCFARFAQLFALFGPARPGCARPYKTNAIPSLFRVFWCPGAHFRKKWLFDKIITKMEKSDFLADFSFLNRNQHFREYGGIAETPIIPTEYQWFWRVDCLENAKFTKVTEIPGILWNFHEFHFFM